MKKPTKPREPIKPSPPVEFIDATISLDLTDEPLTLQVIKQKMLDQISAQKDGMWGLKYQPSEELTDDNLKLQIYQENDGYCDGCDSSTRLYVYIVFPAHNPHFKNQTKVYDKAFEKWEKKLANYNQNLLPEFDHKMKEWEVFWTQNERPKMLTAAEKRKAALLKDLAKLDDDIRTLKQR
jgi:hypothetical protein